MRPIDSNITRAVLYVGGFLLLGFHAAAQPPFPFIQSISPVSVPAGTGSLALTVNGTGFATGSVVYWNGSPLPTISIPFRGLSASVTAAYLATAGTARIQVVSPSGHASNAAYLSIGAPESTILTSRTDRSSGLYPSSQTVADFNGDGRLDLAVTSFGDDTVTILLGDGAGGFSLKGAITVARDPVAILSADFNGDGIADLAIAISGPDDRVSILMGNGDGTFQAPISYNAGKSPSALVAGDFDQDGVLDLAVANAQANTVTVLVNRNGGLVFANSFATGSGPGSLALGDFNGDGLLDIAVANQNENTVGIYSSNGLLKFVPAGSPYPVASNATGGLFVTAADWNGDGNLDLAVASSHSGSLLILLNDGAGGFTSRYTPDSGSTPFGVSAVDFNGDGFPDLLVTDLFRGATVMQGDGTGNFNAPPLHFNTGTQVTTLVAADLDGDGRPDIVAGNKYADATLSSSSLSIIQQSALPFGVVATGQSSARPLTVSNAGAAPLTISSAVASGTNPGDFVPALNTCASVINPGLACDINVTFTPSSSVLENAILTVTDTAGRQTSARLTGGSVAPSRTTLTVGPSDARYGSPLPFSAAVTADSGTPIGMVTFFDGATQIGQSPVDATGHAGFTTSTLQAGTHSFTATYGGSAVYSSSTSGAVGYVIQKVTPGIEWGTLSPIPYGTPLSSSQLSAAVSVPGTLTYQPAFGTILPFGTYDLTVTFVPADSVDYNANSLRVQLTIYRASTTITISGHSPSPSVVGQPVTVSFSVAPQVSGTPTGVVTVTASTGQICSAAVSIGSCSVMFNAPSSPALQANYSGDTNFVSSTSATVTQVVNKQASITTITSNTPNPVDSGQPVTVKVKVAPQLTGTPTGTVTVNASTGESCGPVILVSATGSCSLVLKTGGTVILRATYSGDSNFTGSVSAGASETVTDFSISVTPLTQIITGNSTSVAITFKSKAGFKETIDLTCTSDPKLTCDPAVSSFRLNNSLDTTAALVLDKSVMSGTFKATLTAKSDGGITHSVTVSVTAPK